MHVWFRREAPIPVFKARYHYSGLQIARSKRLTCIATVPKRTSIVGLFPFGQDDIDSAINAIK
jgi:hypothetical protein